MDSFDSMMKIDEKSRQWESRQNNLSVVIVHFSFGFLPHETSFKAQLTLECEKAEERSRFFKPDGLNSLSPIILMKASM